LQKQAVTGQQPNENPERTMPLFLRRWVSIKIEVPDLSHHNIMISTQWSQCTSHQLCPNLTRNNLAKQQWRKLVWQ